MRTLLFFPIVFFLAIIDCNILLAEGTEELSNSDSTLIPINTRRKPGDPFASHDSRKERRLNIEVEDHSKEKIHMGFRIMDKWPNGNSTGSPDKFYLRIKGPDDNVKKTWSSISSGDKGWIDTYQEAVNGPNSINSITGGYNDIVFNPKESGTYYIEFDKSSSFNSTGNTGSHIDFDLFDITVENTNQEEEIKGRVWSKMWSFAINPNGNTYPYGINGRFFIYTNKGVVTKLDMEGATPKVDLASNSFGLGKPGQFTPDSARMSSDSISSGIHIEPDFKFFFNNPDTTIFPSKKIGEIEKDSKPELAFNCKKDDYFFEVNATEAGEVELLIDFINEPGNDKGYDGSRDVHIIEKTDSDGNLIKKWDRRDGEGNIVSHNTEVRFEATYKFGLTHLITHFMIHNPNGFKVSSVRPDTVDAIMFWDDSNISKTNPASSPKVELEGCNSSGKRCRKWGNDLEGTDGYGKNTLNTWWYTNSQTFTDTLKIKNNPKANIDGPALFDICKGSTKKLSVSYSGDTEEDDYKWYNLRTSELLNSGKTTTIQPDDTARYSVEIPNSIGCTVKDTIQANVKTVNLSTSTNDTIVCEGDNINISPDIISGNTNNKQFKWYTDGSNDTIKKQSFDTTFFNPETYYLDVVNNNNKCVSSKHDSVKVDLKFANIITNLSSDTSICYKQDTITLSPNYKGSGASYLKANWTAFPGDDDLENTAKKPSVSPLENTEYVLEVTNTDNGCTRPEKDTIKVNTRHANINTKLPEADSVCYGESIALNPDYTGKGSSNFSVEWFSFPKDKTLKKSQKTPTVNPENNTKYYISVTNDINGCTKPVMDSIEIEVLALPVFDFENFENNSNICKGKTFTLKPDTASEDLNYSWQSSPDVIPSEQSGNHTIKPAINNSTNFTLTITDKNNCKYTDKITLGTSQPKAPDFTIGQGDDSICFNNQPVKINYNGSKTADVLYYDFDDGVSKGSDNTSSPEVEWDTPGLKTISLYSKTGSGKNACYSDTAQNQLNILSPAKLSTVDYPPVCKKGTGKATVNVSGGSGNFSYSWQTEPVQNTKTATGLNAGNYVVKVTDNSFNCNYSITAKVEEKELTPNIKSTPELPANIIMGNEVTVQDSSNYPNDKKPVNYKWYFGDKDSANGKINTHKYKESGNYCIILNVSNKYCTGKDTICGLKVVTDDLIPNVITPNGDGYNDKFTLKKDIENLRYSYNIYNRWGKLIYKGDKDHPWKAEGSSAGVYYYTLKIRDKRFKGWVQVIR